MGHKHTSNSTVFLPATRRRKQMILAVYRTTLTVLSSTLVSKFVLIPNIKNEAM